MFRDVSTCDVSEGAVFPWPCQTKVCTQEMLLQACAMKVFALQTPVFACGKESSPRLCMAAVTWLMGTQAEQGQQTPAAAAAAAHLNNTENETELTGVCLHIWSGRGKLEGHFPQTCRR